MRQMRRGGGTQSTGNARLKNAEDQRMLQFLTKTRDLAFRNKGMGRITGSSVENIAEETFDDSFQENDEGSDAGFPITRLNPLAEFAGETTSCAKTNMRQERALFESLSRWIAPAGCDQEEREGLNVYLEHLKKTSKDYEKQIENMLLRIQDRKFKLDNWQRKKDRARESGRASSLLTPAPEAQELEQWLNEQHQKKQLNINNHRMLSEEGIPSTLNNSYLAGNTTTGLNPTNNGSPKLALDSTHSSGKKVTCFLRNQQAKVEFYHSIPLKQLALESNTSSNSNIIVNAHLNQHLQNHRASKGRSDSSLDASASKQSSSHKRKSQKRLNSSHLSSIGSQKLQTNN